MPSAINPLYPTTGLAYTQQERDNFQAAKDEIEALQVSTSPTGLKLAAFSTNQLGAAQGGTAEGRIAYDIDKAVVVRDTTGPYWLELGQRRTRIGSVAIRPPFGDMPDSSSFVNLFYDSDATKLQLDTGAAWVDIGPGGGGGGGETLTEIIVPAMTYGNTQTVTHAAVPLTDGGIKFAMLATIPGTSQSSTVYPDTFENLNTGAATWIQDAGTAGHFSGVPGANVTSDDFIFIGGVQYGMTITTPPGTAPSSVTLTASIPSASIDAINSVYSLSNEIRPTYVLSYAICPVVSWGYPNHDLITAAQVTTMHIFAGLWLSTTGTGVVRAAVSLDGGTTWLAYNGSTWVTITPSNLEVAGLQGLGGYVADSAGNAIPADDGTPGAVGWGELRLLLVAAGVGLHFRVMLGIRGDGSDTYAYNACLFWQDYDTYQSLFCSGNQYGNLDFLVNRDSTTQAMFYYLNSSFPSVTDVHCQVWI